MKITQKINGAIVIETNDYKKSSIFIEILKAFNIEQFDCRLSQETEGGLFSAVFTIRENDFKKIKKFIGEIK